MNRAHRGPLLLIVAGALLLLAVVAYLINDARNLSLRMEATAERQALDAQSRRSLAEMKTLREENDRVRADRQHLQTQNREILESLSRIEDLLGRTPPNWP